MCVLSCTLILKYELTEKQDTVVEGISTDLHGTTGFIEDIKIREHDVARPFEPKDLIHPPDSMATLQKFFERPILIDEFSWSSSDLANATLYSTSISTALTSNTMWADKLKGYRFVRGTAHIRVQINATPFQQGRLLLHSIPLATAIGTVRVAAHNYNLITKTQHPNVEIDCRNGAGILKVPYISPYTHYDLEKGLVDWGTIYVDVLAPLKLGSGDTSSVSGSVWLYFTDFELMGPYIPQGLGDENDLMSEKPISTALSLLGTAASSFSSKVPSLSWIAQPLSWALDAGSKIASYFGWSKPINDYRPIVVIPRKTRHLNNAQGVSNAESLAIYTDPSVQVMPGFAGTDIDEMSFDYLKTIPAYYDTATWTTSGASGDSIIDWSINILNYTDTISSGADSASCIIGPPFAVLSNPFAYWRGSIKIHLKFVKTQYHSGRLSLTFVPGDGPDQVTLANAHYVTREIIDIRDSEEYIFVAPFMMNRPYISSTESLGRFELRVLNPLKCTTTVAQNMDILMFTSAGEDFELAGPMYAMGAPFFPQMGDATTIAANKTMAHLNVPNETNKFAALCIGEKFTSIKQLITRATRVLSPSYAAALLTDASLGLYAFYMGAIRMTGGTFTQAHAGLDALSVFGSGYLLQRGSVRYTHSYTLEGASAYPPTSMLYYEESAGLYITIDTADTTDHLGVVDITSSRTFTNFPTFSTFVDSNLSGDSTQMPVWTSDVLVPNYCPTLSRLNYYAYTSAGDSKPNEDYCPGVYLVEGVTGGAPRETNFNRVLRSAGDDFQFGLFIGFPPIAVSTVQA